MSIRIGVVGFGYWGPNLFRAFASHPGYEVIAVADPRGVNREKARRIDGRLLTFDDGAELIESGKIDAVAIATPVATHRELAARALRRGKHVLVEKPLCTRAEEGVELIELSKRHGAALLVDHVYVFHDAVRKMKGLKTSGALGAVSYYDSLRVNLGLFQPDMNVLWDLAPHDLSIIDYLFEEEPVHIEATGYSHVNSHLPDIVYVTAHYASRMIAHLNLSWMSPVKVRRIAIGGSRQMVVWDDLNPEERLKIYNSGIDVRPEDERSAIVPTYRIGDIYSPRLQGNEPLARLVDHFGRVVCDNERSDVDGAAGLRIVRQLEAAQKALDASLDKVSGRKPSAPLRPPAS
ncbi:MAG TPA: Gfo/Idh/MocA family oxidoreductase [Stellaceae bacterium]|nr:Gfo/Idh/MocA family oxidoreductase [Stellaceae bacterium]